MSSRNLPKRACKKASASKVKPALTKKLAPNGYPLEDCYREPTLNNSWVFVPKGYGRKFLERVAGAEELRYCPHCNLKPCVVKENLPEALEVGKELELDVSNNNENIRDAVGDYFKSLLKGYFRTEAVDRVPLCVKDFCWEEFAPEDEISVGSTSSSEISFQPIVFKRKNMA